MKFYFHFWYLAQFFLQWERFQTEDVDEIKTDKIKTDKIKTNKIKTNNRMSDNIFPKVVPLWCNMETRGKAGVATDDNTAHAHCTLHNYGYRNTLRIYNTVFKRQKLLHERLSTLRINLPMSIMLPIPLRCEI
jgi:hypothetical protein